VYKGTARNINLRK